MIFFFFFCFAFFWNFKKNWEYSASETKQNDRNQCNSPIEMVWKESLVFFFERTKRTSKLEEKKDLILCIECFEELIVWNHKCKDDGDVFSSFFVCRTTTSWCKTAEQKKKKFNRFFNYHWHRQISIPIKTPKELICSFPGEKKKKS